MPPKVNVCIVKVVCLCVVWCMCIVHTVAFVFVLFSLFLNPRYLHEGVDVIAILLLSALMSIRLLATAFVSVCIVSKASYRSVSGLTGTGSSR